MPDAGLTLKVFGGGGLQDSAAIFRLALLSIANEIRFQVESIYRLRSRT